MVMVISTWINATPYSELGFAASNEVVAHFFFLVTGFMGATEGALEMQFVTDFFFF